ncbi:unnamed protein product [Brassica rapa subsp. trilocularis]
MRSWTTLSRSMFPMNATPASSKLVCILYGTSLRFGTPVGHQGSGTRHLTRISLRRLLNSARLKGFGHATVTLLLLLSCLVQQIFISLRMGFAPCGRMVPTAMVESGSYVSLQSCIFSFLGGSASCVGRRPA